MQYNLVRTMIAANERTPEKGSVQIPGSLFRMLLIGALKNANYFDEVFYTATYSDIRPAIQKRLIENAAEHYFNTGYFEGRLPRKVLVDEKFYLEHNPDVAEAVRKGQIPSAQDHFENTGFKEGRSPHVNFSLF